METKNGESVFIAPMPEDLQPCEWTEAAIKLVNKRYLRRDQEGQIIEFENGHAKHDGVAEVKNVLIDGLGVGDVGNVVLRDRRTMSADGVVMVIVPVEKATGEIVGDIDIVSRGFVYMKEAGELIDGAKNIVRKSVSNEKIINWQFIRKRIEENVEQYLFDKTKRRPMVIAVIVEV